MGRDRLNKQPSQVTFSWQQLYKALQYAELSCDTTGIINQLESKKDIIKLGLDWCVKPDSVSHEKFLKECTRKEAYKIFVCEQSVLIEISELLYSSLLDAVLSNFHKEKHHGYDMVSILDVDTTDKVDARKLKELSFEVQKYYLIEREMTPLVLVSILRRDFSFFKNEEIPVVSDIRTTLLSTTETSCNNIILRSETSISVPLAISTQVEWNRLWLHHLLREKRALYELIFTMLCQNSELINEYGMVISLKIFNSISKFSNKYSSMPLSVNAETQNILTRINNLCIMIIISCMGIKDLPKVDMSLNAASVLPISGKVEHLVDFQNLLESKVGKLSQVTLEEKLSYGSILLAWGLTVKFIIPWLSIYRQVTYNNFLEMMKTFQIQNDPHHIKDKSKLSARIRDPYSVIQFACIECDAQTKIIDILNFSNKHESPYLCNDIKMVFKSMLMLFLDAVECSQFLKYYTDILNWFHLTVDKSPRTADDWWDNDYQFSARRFIIESIRILYTSTFCDFTKVFTSLTCSPKSAYNCYKLLKSINFFSVDQAHCDSHYKNLMEGSGSGTVINIKKSIVAYASNFPFYPPPESTVQKFENVIIFPEWSHSAWHYFTSELDSFSSKFKLIIEELGKKLSTCSSIDIIQQNELLPHQNIVKNAIILISKLVKNLNQKDEINEFSAHIAEHPGASPDNLKNKNGLLCIFEIIASITNTIVSSRDPSYCELFVSCIEGLKSMLSHLGEDAWKTLFSFKLLPLSSNTDSILSYFSEFLLYDELVSGNYTATLAYLELVDNLVECCQSIKFEVNHLNTNQGLNTKKVYAITSLINFLLYNVVPNMNSRRYKVFYHKLHMIDHVFIILNRIMKDTTWDPHLHQQLDQVRKFNSGFEGKSNSTIINQEYGKIQKIITDVLFSEVDNGITKPILQAVADSSSFFSDTNSLTSPDVTIKALKVSSDVLEFIKLILMKRNEMSLYSSAMDSLVHFANLTSQQPYQTNFIQVLEKCLLQSEYVHISHLSIEILGLLLFVKKHKVNISNPPLFYKFVGASLLEVSQTVMNLLNHKLKYHLIECNSHFVAYEGVLFNFLTVAIREDPLIGQVLFKLENNRTQRETLDSSSKLKDSDVSRKQFPLLSYMAETVINYSNNSNNVSSTLAVSILCSFDYMWQNEPAYMNIIDGLRKIPNLFPAFARIVNQFYNDENTLEDKNSISKSHEEVSNHCNKVLAKIFVIRILSQEIFIMYSNKVDEPSDECIKILRTVLNTAYQQCKLGRLFNKDNGAPRYFVELTLLAKELEKCLPIDLYTLEYFRLPAHPWICDKSLEFGDYYYHDLKLLRSKLLSQCFEPVVEIVKRINHCKSLIDTYWNQFRTFELLVNIFVSMDPVLDAPKLQKFGINKHWAYELAMSLAKIVISENNVDFYTVTYLSDVCKTIKTLVFFWVDQLVNELPEYFYNPDKHYTARNITVELNNINGPAQMALKDGVNLLICLSKCLKVSTYNLGPAGVISEYDFYRSIFSSVLKIFSVFNSKNFSQSPKLWEAIMNIIPAAYMALSYVLEGIDINAESCNLYDAKLILALTSEIVPSSEGSKYEEIWLHVLRKYNIVENILSALRSILNLPVRKYASLINSLLENILSSSINPHFSGKIQDAGMWKILCMGSVFKLQGFSNQVQEELPLEPVIPFYKGKSPSAEAYKSIENAPRIPRDLNDPLYSVWCNVLSISAHFINSWGRSPGYMSRALSLLGLYEDQIIDALEQAIPLPDINTELILHSIRHDHDAVLNILKKHSSTYGLLENKNSTDEGIFVNPIVEIDRLTTLFLCLAKWAYSDKNLSNDCSVTLLAYENFALSILSSFIILFENPNELYLRTSVDAVRSKFPLYDDKAIMGRVTLLAKNSMNGLKQDLVENVGRYCTIEVRDMIKVTQTILMHLVINCHAMKIISITGFNKCQNLPKNIFHSTTLVHTNLSGATLGCLFDLLRTLSKFIVHISGTSESDLYKPFDKGTAEITHQTSSTKTKGYPILFYFSASMYPIEEIFSMVEKTLVLATTQILLYKYNKSVPLNQRFEDLRELSSELRSTINTIVDSVETLEKSNYAKVEKINTKKFSDSCRSVLVFAKLIEAFRMREISDP